MFTTIQEGIAAIQKQILSDTPPEQALYIPAQGTHTISRDEKPFDLYQALTEFVVFDNKIIVDEKDSKSSVDQKAVVVKTETRRKVLLLLGETGSGKSVFCQDLIARLWQNYKFGMPIPLFIPLARLQDPINNAIIETFTEYGFSAEQITTLKKEQQFIFILDGYDEIHQLKNLYVTNRLGEWQAKTIITCRSQYLYHVNESDKYFMPFAAEKRQPHLLQQLHVAPFAEKEIVAYVQQYEKTALSPNSKTMAIAVAADTKDHKSDDKTAVAINVSVTDQPLLYQQLISVPGLSSLITTPFLLHLAVEALPEILEKMKDQKSNDQPNFTQAALYDVFIARWFKRQEIKLRTSKHIDEKIVDPKPTFWNFCKALAVAMRTEQVSLVNYTPEKTSRLFATAATAAPKVDPWKDFFSNDAETELLRSACPLRKFGKNQYGFIHGSMIEYFATRTMYDELITQPQATATATNTLQIADTKDSKSNIPIIQNSNQQTNSTPLPKNALYQTLISKDANMIQFLADRVSQDEKFKQKLFEIIELSKTSERHSIGAANAITALARAKVAFSGMDFTGIRINDADVSYGIFDNTNLTNASLKNVDMQSTWLREAKLNNVDMTGVEFGELPSILAPDGIDAFSLSADGQWYVVGSAQKIYLYEMNTRKLEHVFEGCAKDIVAAQFILNDTMLVSRDKEEKYDDEDNKNSTIKLWDIKNKKLVCSHDEEKLGLFEDSYRAYSLTEAIFASAGRKDGSIRLLNVYTGKLEHIFKAHKHGVTAITFSPNGLVLASGSHKTICLWDVINRTLLHTFEGHTAFISSLAFSNNNFLLASTSRDNTLCVWDIASRKQLCVFKSLSLDTVGIGFSPDNNWIVTGQDKIVQLWNIANHKLEHTFEGHAVLVRSVFFHPNGQSIISTSWDKTVRLWLMPKQKSSQDLEEQIKEVLNIAFSPNGCWLASAYKGGDVISLYEIANGRSKYNFKMQGESNVVFSSNNHFVSSGSNNILKVSSILDERQLILAGDYKSEGVQGGEIRHIAISLDKRKLATASADHRVRVWDLINKKLECTFEGHTDQVRCVVFSPDGTKLLSGGKDKQIRLWNLVMYKFERIFAEVEDATFGVSCIDYHPNGQQVAAGSYGTITLWNAVSGKLERVFQEHISYVNKIAFSPNGLLLASAGDDCTVRLWKTSDIKPNQELYFNGHTDKVRSVAFAPNNNTFASAGEDKTIRLWDRASQQLVQQFPLQFPIKSIAFSPDGLKFIVAGRAEIQLWDLIRQKCVHTFDGHSDHINKVKFSPDGRYVASASTDKTVRLWDAISQAYVYIFAGHTDFVLSVCFSNNGRWLASASEDRTIRLWDIVNRKHLYTFAGHTDVVRDVAFSPDDRWLLSGSDDKTVCLWDINNRKREESFNATSTASSVAFHPNGRWIAAGNWHSTIQLWDLNTGAIKYTFDAKMQINSITFSPDGQWLAAGGNQNVIKLWDVSSCPVDPCCAIVKGFSGSVKDVAWQRTQKGLFLATGGSDHAIRYWQVEEDKAQNVSVNLRWSTRQKALTATAADIRGVKQLTLLNHDLLQQRGAITKVRKVFPAQKTIIDDKYEQRDAKQNNFLASDNPNTVQLIEILPVFKEHTKKVNCVAISRDDRWIASGSDDNTVRLWDVVNRKLQYTLQGHTDQVNSVAFSPDNRWLASGSKDTTIQLWDRTSGKLQFTFNGANKTQAIAFSPDGQCLVSGDIYVRLWNMADGQMQHVYKELGFYGDNIVFSPNSQWVAGGGKNNTVGLWSVINKKLEHIFIGHTNTARSVAFSLDGRKLISGSYDKTIRLWDMASKNLEYIFAMDKAVGSLSISPDNRYVAVDSGYSVQLWSLIDKKLVHTFKGHTGMVRSVAFSANGLKLISGSDDTSVRVWDAKEHLLADKQLIDSKKDYKESPAINTKQNIAQAQPQTFFAPQQQPMRTSMSAILPAIQQYSQPVRQNTMQQQTQFFAPPVQQYRQPLPAANPNQFYAAVPVVNQQAAYQPQFFAPQPPPQQQYYHAPMTQQPKVVYVQANPPQSSDCCVIS